MGNKNLKPEDKVKALEKRLLALSGLEVGKDLQILDVKIDFLGDNYIHTLRCGFENEEEEKEESNCKLVGGKMELEVEVGLGRENLNQNVNEERNSESKQKKEILVLIHGYGGSSILFYQMLKDLSTKYQVLCIDLLGMGLSSRPEFSCESTDEAISFFIESIEKWRISMGLDKFIIAGHSFGGYMACQYGVKYRAHVSRMILLSPLGFTKKDSHFDFNDKKHTEGKGFFYSQFFKLRMAFWRDRLTPSILASRYGWLLGGLAKKSLTRRMKVDSKIGDVLWEFILETYKLPVSSEKAIHLIINPNIIAYLPLEDVVQYLDIPMLVVYGDKDWMDDSGARKIMRLNKRNFDLRYLSNCGHQVTMENPKELNEHILNCEILSLIS